MRKCCIFATLLVLSCVTAFGQQPDERGPIAEAYLAKDDGEGNAGEPATEFAPNDIPIHLNVKLSSSEAVTVKMIIVAAKVAGAKPDTQIVAASYTTTEGQNEVYFFGKPQKQWIPGDYRVDIFVDDEKSYSIDFTVKRTAKAPPGTNKVSKGPKRPSRKP